MGIVTTGDSWIFTILTSENNLAATTQSMISLPILDSRLKGSNLMDRVEELFGIIIGMLNDKLDSYEDNPEKRRKRLNDIIGFARSHNNK